MFPEHRVSYLINLRMNVMDLRIVINDREHFVAEGTSVAGVLEILKLQAKFVAVELNRKVVSRANHSATILRDGDQLEVVTLVGGG